MESIVVFCGSGDGFNECYREAAYQLGKTLALRNIGIIYGGAKVGLMGALADGALEHDGKIVGVIPYFLKTKEVVHEGLTKLITVETMHERKLKMHELGDGIITMPGGWGTMEEMFEMLTWGQLGLHTKPVGLLNVNGYYDPLQALCDNMVQEGFLNEFVNATLLISGSIEDLLDQMEAYMPPVAPKWITKQTT
ncbi:MAG: TIGR00730 family Rossman fold protein [Chitinophagales bacterium]